MKITINCCKLFIYCRNLTVKKKYVKYTTHSRFHKIIAPISHVTLHFFLYFFSCPHLYSCTLQTLDDETSIKPDVDCATSFIGKEGYFISVTNIQQIFFSLLFKGFPLLCFANT